MEVRKEDDDDEMMRGWRIESTVCVENQKVISLDHDVERKERSLLTTHSFKDLFLGCLRVDGQVKVTMTRHFVQTAQWKESLLLVKATPNNSFASTLQTWP